MSITGTRSRALRAVAKFVKKPDSAKAAEYIKAGYFWNSGNFMFRAATLRDEYGKFDATSVQAVTSSVTRAVAISALSRSIRMPSARRTRSRSIMR